MKTLTLAAVLTALIVGSVLADDVAVTVYNSNLGVVNETRSLKLENGTSRLEFRDVPSQIDANSVRFEVVDDPAGVTILEQNYAFDLVSEQGLYQKYIDKNVELVDTDGNLYSGTLLSYAHNQSVTLLQESGEVKIVALKHIAQISFPELPEGLITRPTLFWLYDSDVSGDQDCQVSYQTAGMNWSAEYVGILDAAETSLDLSGWAAISNTSGKTYQNAKLKLVAGDIHRAQPKRSSDGYEMDMMAAAPRAKAGFEEKAFFEYHMYTLPRQATLADRESKQISLFEPASSKVKKVFLYRPDQDAKNVQVNVEFENSKETGLGMPLPAGRVRMFKADSDGSLILLGEDQIDHTPKDEDVSIRVGNAFDVVGEQKMTSQTRISRQVDERTWEIELRNRKSEDIVVKVDKRLWGFWDVQKSSHEYTKKDAYTLEFEVPVKADSTETIVVTVRFTNG